MKKSVFVWALVLFILISFSGCDLMLGKFQQSIAGEWKSSNKISDSEDRYNDHYEVFVFTADGTFTHSFIKEGETEGTSVGNGSYSTGYEFFLGKESKDFIVRLNYAEGLDESFVSKSFYATFSEDLNQLNFYIDLSDDPYVFIRQ
ncbi:MAG: hypothetical protein JXR63_01635 [Spirochaetales bacterium]|nr:hypothetical protein [Spirochaetales bacterium]